MAVRNYSNITNVGTLSAAVGTGDPTLAINGGWANLPTFPFYVIVDRGSANEECMLATGGNATALSVTRGYDGSPASSHGISATIEHAVLAEFFNKADTHVESSTNVHGLSGGSAVAGTTQAQTLTNKTINASIVNVAHSTSPAASQAIQVSADAATARDGFVWNKSASATGAAFKAVSSGTTRYSVDADGKLVLNSATGTDKAFAVQESATERYSILNDGTVDAGLQAVGAAGDRVTIRTRPTQTALRIRDAAAASVFSVGAAGNVDASGYIASAGAVSSGTTLTAGTNLTVNGTAAVTGTSTLTGNVTLPLPAAGTTSRLVVNSRTGGANFEGRNQAGTATFVVQEAGHILTSGKALLYNSNSPAVAEVTSTAVVPSPQTDMLVFDTSNDTLMQYNGSSWDVVGRYGTHYNGMMSLLGGKLRTTSASVVNSTTEVQVLDTGSISLPATSRFLIEVVTIWDASSTGDDYVTRIRDTNLAGTMLQEVVAPRTDNLVPYQSTASYVYTTTTATTKTFVAGMARVNGSGSATVKANSYMFVYYIGPSSLITTI